MTSSKARRKRRVADRERSRADESAPPSTPAAPEEPSTSALHRFRTSIVIVAALYLATVWLDGVGNGLPVQLTPRIWVYFSQIAALFAKAGQVAIDYRAEGWSCSEKRWVEIDVRPWFRIDADNKENRFHRALQFYRKERKVMRALEDYVLTSYNRSLTSRDSPDSRDRPAIGGVRFLSLRVPYPALGSTVGRLERKPLAEYPDDQRHAWYYTPTSRRKERCGDHSVTPREPKEPRESREKDDEDRSTTPETKPGEKDPEP